MKRNKLNENKKVKKTINKKDVIISIVVFICLIIIYLPWLNGHNAGDNYVIANDGYIEYAKQNFLPSGRIVTALFAVIMNLLNVNIKVATSISLFISIIIQVITIMYLKNIIKKYKKNEEKSLFKACIRDGVETLIPLSIVSNFFMVDCECFFESFVLALSFLLAIIAANILINKKNIKGSINALILCVVASICYQSSITVFMAFTLLIGLLDSAYCESCKETNKKQEIIKMTFKSILIAFLAFIINLGIIKIPNIIVLINTPSLISSVGKNRISFDILVNIKNILHNIRYVLINTCNLFPKYTLITFIFEIIFIMLLYIMKKGLNIKSILELICIVIWFIFCSLSISLITTSSFTTGRVRIAIGMLVGAMLMYVYIKSDLLDFNKEKLLSSLFIITVLVYCMMNAISINGFIIDQNEVELLDKENAELIKESIERYEKENNIKVRYVIEIPIRGKQSSAYYFEGELNSSALRTLTTAGASINYYTKRNLIYKSIQEDEENVKEFIQEENEGKINEKYYKIVGDTLYIAVYNW